MEKLIRLLNEFERDVYPEDHKYIKFPDGTETDGGYWRVGDGFNFTKKGELYYSEPHTFRDGNEELLIISKSYKFIKRLAKHFMLDMTKIDSRIALSDFNATDRMLMALAISEDPIALLVDCLKQDGETSRVIEGIGDMENKR